MTADKRPWLAVLGGRQVIYRFGPYVFDTDSFALSADGEAIAIEPQVFALLQLLIENRARVVTKDEIIDTVWDGRAISDGALNSRINAARRALGDDGKAQTVIKTFPRRGFRFVAELSDPDELAATSEEAARASHKTSIVVLPFVNRTDDPEQEYFSDGITEDIISALGRIRLFVVVASNNAFAYKGQTIDVRMVARDLQVRYVLVGSVRKSGGRVRISVRLDDGETGTQIWSENYDRELTDIFAVQDEITQTVIGTLEPTMAKEERQRASLSSPENFDAWDHYHRGMSHLFERGEYANPRELVKAREQFQKAIDMDSNFARGHCGITYCLFFSLLTNSAADRAETVDDAFAAVHKAIELDRQDAFARMLLGFIHFVTRDPEATIREGRMALELNPSHLHCHQIIGQALIADGQAEEAMVSLKQAERRGTVEPGIAPTAAWKALGHIFLGDYETAVEQARRALSLSAQFWADAALVTALAYLDRMDEAAEAREALLQRQPGFSCAYIRDRSPITDPGYQTILIDGLRKAGVPED